MTTKRLTLRVSCIVMLASCVLSSACVQSPPRSAFTGFYKDYWNCRDQYAEMDARVDAAGVRDAEFYRVPGHPYLRTDRLLATFRHQVKGLNDVSEWIRRMRELDQDSREFEYINLGIGELDASLLRARFQNCGKILADIELERPGAWERLQDAVVPRDAYLASARFFGLHLLRISSIRDREAAMRAEREQWQMQRPIVPKRQWIDWATKPVEDLSLMEEMRSTVTFNALGFPSLYGSQWRALVEAFAPRLAIEAGAEADGPTMPIWTSTGIDADSEHPAVSYQIGYTRFGGQLLVQITYTFWFRADPAGRSVPLDGLSWRVTLDRQLEPLTYESVHVSGRDHRWYPVRSMELRGDAQARESFVSPQLAPARAATLWMDAATHLLRRVAAADDDMRGERREFELRPYEDLYTLPLPDGGSRSLFGPDGLVVQGEGHDDVAGWSSGISQPGVARQAGHLAIGYIERRHFDDPDLMDETFVAPSPVETPTRAVTVSAGSS